jgi:hypothetical protein
VHQHHAELVVAQFVSEARVFLRRTLAERSHELRLFVAQRGLATELVECAIAGHLEQPGARILRDAAQRPLLHRRHERLLHDLFGQRQMRRAEDPREGGDHLSRAVAEQMIDQRVDVRRHVRQASSMRRISMEPKSRCGQSSTIFDAAS